MHTCKTKSLRMKYLFFFAVALGIFPGTFIKVTAQTSINLESVAGKHISKTSLHFIEGIEITPEKISDNLSADNVNANNEVENTMVPSAGDIASDHNIEQCSATQFKYATMMNREVETLTDTALYNFIDEWWATRYRYGGTDKYGIDCSAFAGKVLESVYGISLPRTAAEQYKLSERISKNNLVEGDLVFFNTRGGISHEGVYLGNNYFVHSSVNGGVTISSLTDNYYSRTFISGGRVCK